MSNSKSSHKCRNYFATLLMVFVCLVLALSYLRTNEAKTETPSIHDLEIDSVTIIPDDLIPYQPKSFKSSRAHFAQAQVGNSMHKHRNLNSDRSSSGSQTTDNVDSSDNQFKTRDSDYDCFYHEVDNVFEWNNSWNSRSLYPKYVSYLENSKSGNSSTCLAIHDLYYKSFLEGILKLIYYTNYIFQKLNVTYFIDEGLVLAILRGTPIQAWEKDVDFRVMLDTDETNHRQVMDKFRITLANEYDKLLRKCLIKKGGNDIDYKEQSKLLNFFAVSRAGEWRPCSYLLINALRDSYAGYGEVWGFSIGKNSSDDDNKTKNKTKNENKNENNKNLNSNKIIHLSNQPHDSFDNKIDNHGAGLYLPVRYKIWEPYGWKIPIPHAYNTTLRWIYGPGFMQPPWGFDGICTEQIEWLRAWCGSSFRKTIIDECALFLNLLKDL